MACFEVMKCQCWEDPWRWIKNRAEEPVRMLGGIGAGEVARDLSFFTLVFVLGHYLPHCPTKWLSMDPIGQEITKACRRHRGRGGEIPEKREKSRSLMTN